MRPSRPPVFLGEMIGEKYRVERVLGEGGMGLVVLATHVELDQAVAIKCLLPEAALNANAVDRFAREARACAKLRGENVVHVTDVGLLDSGAPFMVMEYLRGEDLGQHLLTNGPLTVDDAIDLMIQACAGLTEAHNAGIIHRDLKPANLFLATREDTGRVLKVVDFGISKLMDGKRDGHLTSTQDLMGSPLYMSPEQLRSLHDVDGRTDIWAIGIILYELLAGTPPFQGDTLPQVCSAVLVNQPAPLASVRSELPLGLTAVVAKCLEKEPARRFSSATALAEALAPFAPARSEPTLARIARMASARGIEMAPTSTQRAIPMPVAAVATESLPPPPRPQSKAIWMVLVALLVGALATLAIGRRHTDEPALTAPPKSEPSISAPLPSASASASSAPPATAPPAVSVVAIAPIRHPAPAPVVVEASVAPTDPESPYEEPAPPSP